MANPHDGPKQVAGPIIVMATAEGLYVMSNPNYNNEKGVRVTRGHICLMAIDQENPPPDARRCGRQRVMLLPVGGTDPVVLQWPKGDWCLVVSGKVLDGADDQTVLRYLAAGEALGNDAFPVLCVYRS